jgi:four helix bundle protein
VFLAFKELAVYGAAGGLSDDIRACVLTWESIDIWSAGIQLIRSSDSIAANIAEGTGRHTFRDQLRFYVVARGSLHEVRHWLIRATARELTLPNDVERRADEIGRMLNGLIGSTHRRTKNQELRTKNFRPN